MTHALPSVEGSSNELPESDVVGTVAPILAFLAANRLGGLRAGIAGATVVALVVALRRRRQGQAIGRLMPVATAAIVARGVVGIVTNSEDWYFGLGIAAKFAAALALVVSIVVRRPLADRVAAALLPVTPAVRAHPRWIRTMAILSGIGALYFCAAGTIDIWLFQRNSVEGFVLLRFLTNWPLGALALGTAGWVCSREFPKIPDLGPLSALLDPTSTTADRAAQ